jgi:hypothetical protein
MVNFLTEYNSGTTQMGNFLNAPPTFPLFFYSCADLLLLWAETFYTTWRLRGALKVFCNMRNKNIYNKNWKFQLRGNNSVCVVAFQLLRGRAL